MNGIESEIGKVLSDQRELEKLLLLEKEKRGVGKNKLVFIGIANIADYYWCAMQSLFKSKKMELDIFHAYLHDRVYYSFHLGLITNLPKNKEKLLEIGNEITLKDVEKLLKERENKKEQFIVEEITREAIDKNGNKVIVVNPNLPPEERKFFENQAKNKGVRIANIEEFPKIRGEFFHTEKSISHPTIRWNFNCNDYVIVGVPDGIEDDCVYEYKTTRNNFLMYFVKPVAYTQADLYGYFFKRGKKRVQIYIVDEKITKTWENQVDRNRVLEVFRNFKKVDEGWTPPLPKTWKCKSCKFKDACKLYNGR